MRVLVLASKAEFKLKNRTENKFPKITSNIPSRVPLQYRFRNCVRLLNTKRNQLSPLPTDLG